MPSMDQAAFEEIKRFEAAGQTEDTRYMELLIEHDYVHHVLRMPVHEWPDPVVRTFDHLNQALYVSMQGPSELGASGKLTNWDGTADLPSIEVRTLVIGAEHDTRDPEHLRWMASGAAPRDLPALPERQPPGHVRRSSDLHGRADRVPDELKTVESRPSRSS